MHKLLYILSASDVDLKPLPRISADSAEFARILTVVFTIAGSIALLMLVIGGYRYIISNGDPSKTAQAKNTIIYSIVGLVVVIAAASIVALAINLA